MSNKKDFTPYEELELASIMGQLLGAVYQMKQTGGDFSKSGWRSQEGILITGNEAALIIKVLNKQLEVINL